MDRGGADDGNRTRTASLEDRAAIMVLTSKLLTCGYTATDDRRDCCSLRVTLTTRTRGHGPGWDVSLGWRRKVDTCG